MTTEPSTTPVPPLFSPLQIAVASFIGGPVPACWLFARNYELLGQPRRARRTLGWGVLGMIVLIAAPHVLPPTFPWPAIPIGYTFGLYYTAQSIHGALVRERQVQGAAPAPWVVVFRVSVVVLVVLLLVALVLETWLARG